MPNAKSYPWQWLWDSCFHAVAWGALGDKRAVAELESLFELQLPTGFMPHMGYQSRPQGSLHYWDSPGRSDITQPPMYGHALRVLADLGYEVDHLYEKARRGLAYLFKSRLDPDSGLIRAVHPWETGCDDSPRWDGLRPLQGRLPKLYERKRWYATKVALVRSLQKRDGAATANPGFDVCSIGFSALVAFNAYELAALTSSKALMDRAAELTDAIDRRWLEERKTWTDVCLAGPAGSESVRTLESLLPILVSTDERNVEAAFAEIFSESSFWRPYGPTGTAVDEATYDPRTYWRGPVWPQLTYLVMVAAMRHERRERAITAASALVEGCVRSGFSEYWHPETGKARGATPQGWAALAWNGVLVLRGLTDKRDQPGA
jgi:hypothetical protein